MLETNSKLGELHVVSHTFHSTVLREYDVRGIVGETLDTQDARAVGLSFGTMVRRQGGSTVVVCCDGRHSSPRLTEALISGLMATGCIVTRIGVGPTPMLYFSVFDLEADAGVMVTGSHNPANWNGFKMMLADRPVYGADIRLLGDMAAAGDWETGTGEQRSVPMIDRYVERLLQDFRGGAFKIGWDCGNGAAGPVVERLTKLLPGEHLLLYTEVDGDFPNHHPDPTVEANLADLKQLVVQNACDFGVAFDGDADRIGAVDGQGRVVWGDQLLSILAQPVLSDLPGATVIADVKASQTLFDRITLLGGKPAMWKTGHSLIKARMKELGAPLAGEMSGHIFFGHRWYGVDDGILGAVRLIEAVTAQGGSLTSLKDAMPVVQSTPELRFQSSEERKFRVVEEVLARLKAEGAIVDETDGARVQRDGGWWLLRASNTQDVLVGRVEAVSLPKLDALKAELFDQLSLSGVAAQTVSH